MKKITILDNVTKMGWYNSSNSDSIFGNHNEDLTIYCYKDSMAANYAIKYNIKYVYLTKPVVDDNLDGEGNKNDVETPKTEESKQPEEPKQPEQPPKDDTTATEKIPDAGVGKIIISFIAIAMVSIIICKKYIKYKDIK